MWLLWRLCGKRLEAFKIATNWNGPIPKSMLDVFFSLDGFYAKMELQKVEKEAESKAKTK